MLEFVVEDGAKRTLKLRDGQHESQTIDFRHLHDRLALRSARSWNHASLVGVPPGDDARNRRGNDGVLRHRPRTRLVGGLRLRLLIGRRQARFRGIELGLGHLDSRERGVYFLARDQIGFVW